MRSNSLSPVSSLAVYVCSFANAPWLRGSVGSAVRSVLLSVSHLSSHLSLRARVSATTVEGQTHAIAIMIYGRWYQGDLASPIHVLVRFTQ